MIRALCAFAVCFWMMACAKPEVRSCSATADTMMALSFNEFDQGSDGWRSLATKLACSDYADDVLASYRSRHAFTLSPANASILTWHEAQVRAEQGETDAAVALIRQAAFPNEPDWQRLYREGTIAFLEGDLDRLSARRADLARLPSDPDLATLQGTEASWPPNLDVLDGLISCFGSDYSAAYACRAPSAAR